MVTVAAISQQIWDMKYRLRGPTGEPVDKTIEDTWRRVARALAVVEKDPDFWVERFYAAYEDVSHKLSLRMLVLIGEDAESPPCTLEFDRPVLTGVKETAESNDEDNFIGCEL